MLHLTSIARLLRANYDSLTSGRAQTTSQSLMVTLILDLSFGPVHDALGEGPTRDAVTDHIAQALIDVLPDQSLSGADIIRHTGDHPGTTYRQLRVLATNSPECPHRLRGWVRSFDHGRYGLTQAAIRKLGGPA